MTDEYDLIEFDKVSADIAEIQYKGNFLPDCSTTEGYESSNRFCLDYTVKARKALTDAHKNTKAPFLKTCRLLDEKKTELMDILQAIELPHMLAYKAHDEDKARKKSKFEKLIRDKIQVIVDYKAQSIGKTVGEIYVMICACCETNIESGFFHLKDEANTAKKESLRVLRISISQAREAEDAAEKLKVANEKQIQNDYEVALLLNDKFDRDVSDKLSMKKLEAAEQEKEALVANALEMKRLEQQRIEDKAQAKLNEEAAANRARQQQIDRQEQERERLEIEVKQRAQDERHVFEIGKAAVDAVVKNCNVTDEQADLFIKCIALNLIPNVTITF